MSFDFILPNSKTNILFEFSMCTKWWIFTKHFTKIVEIESQFESLLLALCKTKQSRSMHKFHRWHQALQQLMINFVATDCQLCCIPAAGNRSCERRLSCVFQCQTHERETILFDCCCCANEYRQRLRQRYIIMYELFTKFGSNSFLKNLFYLITFAYFYDSFSACLKFFVDLRRFLCNIVEICCSFGVKLVEFLSKIQKFLSLVLLFHVALQQIPLHSPFSQKISLISYI